jgi:hypothetical protein
VCLSIHFVLHKDFDEIARSNGWRVHTDGLHLNSRSGKMLADLVQAFMSAGTDAAGDTGSAGSLPFFPP